MQDSRRRQCADLLKTWLDIDSTTGREAAFLAALEAYFDDLGFDCTRQPVADDRWNLLVRRTARPRLLYATHVDTVPPYFGARIDDGAVFGRGACDTKGGIVAMAMAGQRLIERGRQDFGYLFVVGEEVDHIGARTATELDVSADRIVLCEPTQNRVVAAQKGMLKVEVSADGVAGHSAYPDRGDSAVHHLLDALGRLRREALPTDELLGATTVNVGTIDAGVAANVFAPSAAAWVLLRTVSDTEALLGRLEQLVAPDARIETAVYNDPVFFEPPDGFDTGVVPFNTDATYLSQIAPIWLVGPGDIRHAHCDHEHIDLDSLVDGIDLYQRLADICCE